MAHEVLENTSPADSTASELTLTYHDGTTATARGVLARLPESPADVVAAWSRGGTWAFVDDPGDDRSPAFLTQGNRRYRVIYSERTAGGGGVFPLLRCSLAEAN